MHVTNLSPPDDINKQWNINTLLCPSCIFLQWPSRGSNRPCNNSFSLWRRWHVVKSTNHQPHIMSDAADIPPLMTSVWTYETGIGSVRGGARVGEQCTWVSSQDPVMAMWIVTSSAWCSPVIISGSRWAQAKSILSLSLLSRLSLICWILIIASSFTRALILTLTYARQMLRGWLLQSTWWAFRFQPALVEWSCERWECDTGTLSHWAGGIRTSEG